MNHLIRIFFMLLSKFKNHLKCTSIEIGIHLTSMCNNEFRGAIVLNKIANIPSDNLKSPHSVTLSESFVSNEF